MLRSFWDHSVGSWMHDLKRRDYQRRWDNYCAHERVLTTLPHTRPRRLTESHMERSQHEMLPGCSGSRLLNLPAEVRLLIWEYALGGNYIAIYRENSRRLVHTLLNETNTMIPTRNVPVQTDTIEDAALHLPKSMRKHNKRLLRTNKLHALGFLQSCRLIYSEAVGLLYSNNSFIFLQNTTITDFYRSVRPERYASIRSVHLHWQIREYPGGMARQPWSEVELDLALRLLAPTNIPHLDYLSIFIQGPLTLRVTCKNILSQLRNLHDLHADDRVSQLGVFTVRFPYPWLLNSNFDWHSQGLEEALADPNLPFKIVRPDQPLNGALADLDTGVDVGWRYGVLFLPPAVTDEGSLEIAMRSYLVWTPLPMGGTWPYWFPP